MTEKPAKSKEMAKQKLLNIVQMKRKSKSHSADATSKKTPSHPQHVHDALLTRMAIEEIQKETSVGADRTIASSVPSAVPRLDTANKRLLSNTLRSVVAHNRRQADPSLGRRQKSERELDAIIAGGQRRQPKFGERKHCFRRSAGQSKEGARFE